MKKQTGKWETVHSVIVAILLAWVVVIMNVGFSSYEKRMVEDGVVQYAASSSYRELNHYEVKYAASLIRVSCNHGQEVSWTTDSDTKFEWGDKVRVSLVETYRRKYPWPFSFTWVYDKVRAEGVVFVERPPSTKVPMFCDENNRCLIYFSSDGITTTTEPK